MSAAPEIEDVLALSPLQQGLFTLSEMSGDGLDVYSMQFVVEITGPLDVDRLHRSVDAIVDRHPNLRVSLWDKDLPTPVQIVPSHVEVPWEEMTATAAEFDALAVAERARRFDLRDGPLLRVKLVDLPGDRRRLLVTAHHILMDGWAVALFFAELLAIYSADGSAASLPPVRPYRNYIAWLAAQDTDAARAAWREHLDGVEPLMLAAPTVPVSEPVRTRHRLSVTDTERLVSWARSTGLTINTVTQFAWAVVLSRLTDRNDVVFGTTISGRPQGLAGADEMIGLFINTVPARVRLSGFVDGAPATVASVCAALQRDSAALRDQGHLGLSEIQRSSGHGSLFDTLFIFENAPIGAATEPVSASDGTRFLPLAMESLAHYPLTVVAYLLDGELIVITESIDEALGEIEAADVAQRILAVLRELPDAADTCVDHLDVLLPDEQAALAPSGHDAPADLPSTVVEAFVRQCERTPAAPALVSDDRSLTYADLLGSARRLAAELCDHGVAPESIVAVALPRSAESVIAILATMLAGAAYVPIDLAFPDARVANLLQQSGAAVVVTDQAHAGRFADDVVVVDDAATAARIAARADAPGGRETAPAIGPASAAYLIFTSGSTGEPKGVIGTHAALVSYCRDHRDHILAPARTRLGRPLRIAHAWTFSFDASWQPLAGLLDGHAIHLFGEDEMRDAGRLVAGLARDMIDMIDTTPSMFGQLAAAGLVGGDAADDSTRASGHLSVLALGGEAIGPALWSQLSALPDTVVHNCYGPTETTVEAIVARVSDSATPTIGTPTDRMSAYILDSWLRPTPTGVAGELYLSGAQVTRGYQRKSAMTSTRFVADPFRPRERMYRTGDLVRRNAAGNILFVGRSDDQVKIRGYRIETGEVESAIRRVDGVTAAAVIVVDRAAGPALVGFAAGDDLDGRSVRADLAKTLPAHMVPSRIVGVPVLPMNSNGKVDAIVLAESAAAALQARATADDVDLTPTATIVAGVIADVLGTAPGPDEDFFDLGLDSIVAMAAVNALRGHDLTVTPRMVLSHPTVVDLADAIDHADEVGSTSAGPGPVAALPVVEWMYEYGRYRRFTQTVLFALPPDLSDDDLIAVLQATVDAHDMLRSIVTPDGLVTRERGVVDADTVLTAREVDELPTTVTVAAREANDRVDPAAGRMMAATRLRCKDSPDVLLLAVHHLAVDAVSWQVLFADLAGAGHALRDGTSPSVPAELTDYRAWSDHVAARADSPEVLAQEAYWAAEVAGEDPAIGTRRPEPSTDTWASLRSAVTQADVDVTATILRSVDRTTGVREFLLAALTLTIAAWRAQRGEDAESGAYVALEGHGREDHLTGPDVDTSRTLGWFTSVFPVRLGAGRSTVADDVLADPAQGRELLAEISRHIAEIPSNGLDFGVLKYLSRLSGLQTAPEPQIEFNYLGRFDLHTPATQWQPWSPITDLDVNDRLPTDPEPDLPLRYALDIVAVIRATDDGPALVTNWRYGDTVLTAEDVVELTAMWERAVVALAGAVNDPALLHP